ncbi:MAG: F0F1 ATP synthase subunit A, partial [Bacteroidales bacterium]|nr:F0F1 ATP synthase subunit A [Bacteroidales bacterium]
MEFFRSINKRILALAAMVLLVFFCVVPAGASSGGEGEDVVVKDIVLEHINDSYEWHIGKFWGKHVAIPLPVILYTKEKGLVCFSSSHLHGGHTYRGFQIAQEGDYAGKVVELLPCGSQIRPLDFSITKTVAGLLVNSAIVVLMILGAARYYRRNGKVDSQAPKGWAGLVEMLVESLVDGVIKPCVGPRYRKFAPYLLTAFTFIFVNNIMGIIPIFPAGTNITGNIAATLVLAVATFLVTNLYGTK